MGTYFLVVFSSEKFSSHSFLVSVCFILHQDLNSELIQDGLPFLDTLYSYIICHPICIINYTLQSTSCIHLHCCWKISNVVPMPSKGPLSSIKLSFSLWFFKRFFAVSFGGLSLISMDFQILSLIVGPLISCKQWCSRFVVSSLVCVSCIDCM